MISSSTSSCVGLLHYDCVTNQISVAYSTGYYWRYVYKLYNGEHLISGEYSSSSGILKYSPATKSISLVYDSGNGFAYFFEPTPGKCLIGANAWQGAGLFLYEESSNTVTKILDINDYGWNHYQSLPDGDFLIANNNTSSTAGILYYNANDGSALSERFPLS